MNKLPIPPDDFTRQVYAQIERMDTMNRKKNENIDLGLNQLILTSPNGSRFAVVVSDMGLLSTMPI